VTSLAIDGEASAIGSRSWKIKGPGEERSELIQDRHTNWFGLVWFPPWTGENRERKRTDLAQKSWGGGSFADGLAALVGVGGWRTLEEAAGELWLAGGFMQARLLAQRSSSGRLVLGEPCQCRWDPTRRCLRWLVHVDLARSGGRRRSLNLGRRLAPASGIRMECGALPCARAARCWI
jgi:hypothetical protein